MPFPLSVAHLAGLTAFQLALFALFLDPRLAAIPLAVFLLACLIAPFLPGSWFFLPVASHGSRKEPRVALSFDDGPDPATTPRLLDLLDRHGLKAAFFLVGVKAEAHPELVREILARGHEIGNHSWHHHPWLPFRGRRFLRDEVAKAQEIFQAFGILPRAFRPPVGITTPPLWPVLLEQGMFCVNFSCRGWDAGNRRIRGLAARLLGKVRSGDMVLLHDVKPPAGDVDGLFSEFETLLAGLKAKGLEVVAPSRLIGRSLMARRAETRGAVEVFYDDLAETYDREQFETAVARSRTLELNLFRARMPELLKGAGRVLEIGAGTGIFTLEMAPHCGEVHAVDLSGNMLRRLEAKAAAAGLANVRTLEGNAEALAFEGPYSAVTSFLAFEYFRDLPGFLQRLAPAMEPGARIYFVTARTSFFRLFTQIGNAIRQGLWLRSRTRRELEAMLRAAGVTEIRCERHLLKSIVSGGMLWEVEGRWPGTPPPLSHG